MMKLKKLVVGILCSAMLLSSGPAFAEVTPENLTNGLAIIKADLNLNGEMPNTQGVLYGGEGWVPLRAVADSLGIAIRWDAETRTVTMNDGVRIMEFREGDKLYCSWCSSPDMIGMTAPTELSGAPVIAADGRMWVPAKVFEVLVGYDVCVQDSTIIITYQSESEK